MVQLAIEPLPVPLAGVALGLARSLLGHRAEAGNKEDQDFSKLIHSSTELATMNVSSTVLELKRRSTHQERLHCHLK